MHICTKCGTEYDENLTSCPFCGEPNLEHKEVVKAVVQSVNESNKRIKAANSGFSVPCLIFNIVMIVWGFICISLSSDTLIANYFKFESYVIIFVGIVGSIFSLISLFSGVSWGTSVALGCSVITFIDLLMLIYELAFNKVVFDDYTRVFITYLYSLLM